MTDEEPADPEQSAPRDGAGRSGAAWVPPQRRAADRTASSGPPARGASERVPSPRTGPEEAAPAQDASRPAERAAARASEAGSEHGEEHGGKGRDTASSEGLRSAGPQDGDGVRGPHPQEPLPHPSEGHDHQELQSLLGAWALGACRPGETTAVEAHLTGCATCAEEAGRLRDAVPLLEPQRTLDLDPALRPDVLAGCLDRRPARLPMPAWAQPFEAETARLDALLHDMRDEEWLAPVRMRWFSGDSPVGRSATVPGVLAHLAAVDGLLGPALGLPDPLDGMSGVHEPAERTEAQWQRIADRPREARQQTWTLWRSQTRSLVRAAGQLPNRGDRQIVYWTPEGFGGGAFSLADSFLDRAFACWVHAHDIAEAVDYPYAAPAGPHLRMLVDLAARRLPVSIADRRRSGLTGSPGRLAAAGDPGRTLHLEVEGAGGGHWYIPLDSPTAAATREGAVAHVALEADAFCRLAAGRITPDEAAAGGDGDPRAIQDVLFATAALSRL